MKNKRCRRKYCYHTDVFIAKDKKAVADWQHGTSTDNQFIMYQIPTDEYLKLWRCRLFDYLNDRFDLWIDDGEEESITAEQLKAAYYTMRIRCDKKSTWLKIVETTIERGTVVYLAF